jgi:hypothetical protein
MKCTAIPFTMRRDAAARWGPDINLLIVPVLLFFIANLLADSEQFIALL